MKENIIYSVCVCHFWKHILKSIDLAIHFSVVFNGDIQAARCADQSGF